MLASPRRDLRGTHSSLKHVCDDVRWCQNVTRNSTDEGIGHTRLGANVTLSPHAAHSNTPACRRAPGHSLTRGRRQWCCSGARGRRQWCLLPRVSAVVSRRLPATPCSVLRAAVLARGPAAPQCAATVANLPESESRMSDGDDAGDCPEVCGCQSPESECVPSLLRCLQSLPGVSALIVPRLSTSSLRVLANEMLAADASCAAIQAVKTGVGDAATAGVRPTDGTTHPARHTVASACVRVDTHFGA